MAEQIADYPVDRYDNPATSRRLPRCRLFEIAGLNIPFAAQPARNKQILNQINISYIPHVSAEYKNGWEKARWKMV